jgi:hypothetical protein
MASTTIKLSVETRDRLKELGGDTYENTIIEALDALDRERFCSQADAAAAWRQSLAPEERAKLEAAEAAEFALWDELDD